MTSLRFLGDLALWQGLLVAAVVGGLSWWLYWRETRVLSGAARWLLPSLRTAAIVLALLVLTAPVLHHRYREGEPGRLRFLIDSSRSMSIADRHFDRSTKLQIAQSLGWTERAAPSTGPGENSDGTQTAATSNDPAAQPFNEPSKETAAHEKNADGVNASESQAGAIERFDNSQRYRRAVERLLTGDDGVLGALRDDFEIVVQRFDRQRSTLWESTLTETAPLPNDPRAWLPNDFPSVTQLGAALAITAAPTIASVNADKQAGTSADRTGLAESIQEQVGADETLVLLSDGRNTAGVSPLAIAENLASQRRPVYVIGIGGTQAPEDISLVTIEHPERVFERDMLRGTLVVRARMKQSAPLKMAIQLNDRTVWEETRTLSATDRGRVEFAFPVKPLVEEFQKSAARSTDFTSVPLHLRATIEPQAGEADEANNTRTFHVAVVTKRSKLLLVDGRSRWETRYLHNMFERDPAWQVDIVLPDYRQSPPKLPRGTQANQWPSTKERLMEYDLVILGELPASVAPRESLDWLKSFVESSGGGLIVIDGARGTLRDPIYRPVQAMLPIEWIDDRRVKPDPVPIHLTSSAKQLSAFQLTPLDPAKNEAAWAELPPLHLMTAVKALPGSEVLATYTQESAEVPVMATRQFGAGRVFYSGTDETWRWRYKVADTYHQRFWNQVGRWVMCLPMSVQGQFVAIDSGKLVYQPGETISIRSRLRNAQGEPATGLTVEAAVTQIGTSPDTSNTTEPVDDQASNTSSEANSAGSRVVAVVPLSSDAAIAGVYSGQINAPAGGNYQVSIIAPGLTSSALAIHSEFAVVEPDGGEMDQLSCDEPLLMKLAEITGGKYLPEERGHELADLLRPLSRGKIVESDSLIWQSYWWFVPIVLLLSFEWWLRKRAGLI